MNNWLAESSMGENKSEFPQHDYGIGAANLAMCVQKPKNKLTNEIETDCFTGKLSTMLGGLPD